MVNSGPGRVTEPGGTARDLTLTRRACNPALSFVRRVGCALQPAAEWAVGTTFDGQ
jgi:hypothetical protein